MLQCTYRKIRSARVLAKAKQTDLITLIKKGRIKLGKNSLVVVHMRQKRI